MSVQADTDNFQRQYISIRRAEGRLYSDELVRQLPAVPPGHPLEAEWSIRAKSAERLIRYLKAKRRPLQVLDLGCGNGWLTARLANIKHARVWGMDINAVELDQARRVFADQPSLHFEWGSVSADCLRHELFDIILLSASVQYFPDLRELLQSCMMLLNPVGEIHIMDSHFYQPREVAEARLRSEQYFMGMHQLGMQAFYYHHTYESLQDFHPKLMRSWRDFLPGQALHFPWIRIDK